MKKAKGFTLLEMVVAISIFAVIAAISYAGLVRFLDARAIINDRQDGLRSLQRTITLLETDVRFMTNRPVRDGFGDLEAALVSSGDLPLAEGEFIRLTTNRPNPELGSTSRLQRVAWRLIEGDLQRVVWAVLDRDQDSKEYVSTVLQGVETATMRYFFYSQSDNLEVEGDWANATALPAGIEFVLTLRDGAQYQRLFAVAGSS